MLEIFPLLLISAVEPDVSQIPSSQRAREAECASSKRPDWCSEVGLGGPKLQPRWKYKNWTVRLLSDQMDVEKQASVSAKLYDEEGYAAGKIELIIWNGGRSITHHAGTGYAVILERKGWPFCDRNLDRIAVDEKAVQYIATLEKPGNCHSINPRGNAISAMKRGQVAKVRLSNRADVFTLPLSGFTKAIDRAIAQTRR